MVAGGWVVAWIGHFSGLFPSPFFYD
jgi:hypothetical protein